MPAGPVFVRFRSDFADLHSCALSFVLEFPAATTKHELGVPNAFACAHWGATSRYATPEPARPRNFAIYLVVLLKQKLNNIRNKVSSFFVSISRSLVRCGRNLAQIAPVDVEHCVLPNCQTFDPGSMAENGHRHVPGWIFHGPGNTPFGPLLGLFPRVQEQRPPNHLSSTFLGHGNPLWKMCSAVFGVRCLPVRGLASGECEHQALGGFSRGSCAASSVFSPPDGVVEGGGQKSGRQDGPLFTTPLVTTLVTTPPGADKIDHAKQCDERPKRDP